MVEASTMQTLFGSCGHSHAVSETEFGCAPWAWLLHAECGSLVRRVIWEMHKFFCFAELLRENNSSFSSRRRLSLSVSAHGDITLISCPTRSARHRQMISSASGPMMASCPALYFRCWNPGVGLIESISGPPLVIHFWNFPPTPKHISMVY